MQSLTVLQIDYFGPSYSLFIELTADQAPKLALVTTSATTAATTADTSVSTTVTEAPIKLRASRKRRQTATETVG